MLLGVDLTQVFDLTALDTKVLFEMLKAFLELPANQDIITVEPLVVAALITQLDWRAFLMLTAPDKLISGAELEALKLLYLALRSQVMQTLELTLHAVRHWSHRSAVNVQVRRLLRHDPVMGPLLVRNGGLEQPDALRCLKFFLDNTAHVHAPLYQVSVHLTNLMYATQLIGDRGDLVGENYHILEQLVLSMWTIRGIMNRSLRAFYVFSCTDAKVNDWKDWPDRRVWQADLNFWFKLLVDIDGDNTADNVSFANTPPSNTSGEGVPPEEAESEESGEANENDGDDEFEHAQDAGDKMEEVGEEDDDEEVSQSGEDYSYESADYDDGDDDDDDDELSSSFEADSALEESEFDLYSPIDPSIDDIVGNLLRNVLFTQRAARKPRSVKSKSPAGLVFLHHALHDVPREVLLGGKLNVEDALLLIVQHAPLLTRLSTEDVVEVMRRQRFFPADLVSRQPWNNNLVRDERALQRLVDLFFPAKGYARHLKKKGLVLTQLWRRTLQIVVYRSKSLTSSRSMEQDVNACQQHQLAVSSRRNGMYNIEQILLALRGSEGILLKWPSTVQRFIACYLAECLSSILVKSPALREGPYSERTLLNIIILKDVLLKNIATMGLSIVPFMCEYVLATAALQRRSPEAVIGLKDLRDYQSKLDANPAEARTRQVISLATTDAICPWWQGLQVPGICIMPTALSANQLLACLGNASNTALLLHCLQCTWCDWRTVRIDQSFKDEVALLAVMAGLYQCSQLEIPFAGIHPQVLYVTWSTYTAWERRQFAYLVRHVHYKRARASIVHLPDVDGVLSQLQDLPGTLQDALRVARMLRCIDGRATCTLSEAKELLGDIVEPKGSVDVMRVNRLLRSLYPAVANLALISISERADGQEKKDDADGKEVIMPRLSAVGRATLMACLAEHAVTLADVLGADQQGLSAILDGLHVSTTTVVHTIGSCSPSPSAASNASDSNVACSQKKIADEAHQCRRHVEKIQKLQATVDSHMERLLKAIRVKQERLHQRQKATSEKTVASRPHLAPIIGSSSKKTSSKNGSPTSSSSFSATSSIKGEEKPSEETTSTITSADGTSIDGTVQHGITGVAPMGNPNSIPNIDANNRKGSDGDCGRRGRSQLKTSLPIDDSVVESPSEQKISVHHFRFDASGFATPKSVQAATLMCEHCRFSGQRGLVAFDFALHSDFLRHLTEEAVDVERFGTCTFAEVDSRTSRRYQLDITHLWQPRSRPFKLFLASSSPPSSVEIRALDDATRNRLASLLIYSHPHLKTWIERGLLDLAPHPWEFSVHVVSTSREPVGVFKGNLYLRRETKAHGTFLQQLRKLVRRLPIIRAKPDTLEESNERYRAAKRQRLRAKQQRRLARKAATAAAEAKAKKAAREATKITTPKPAAKERGDAKPPPRAFSSSPKREFGMNARNEDKEGTERRESNAKRPRIAKSMATNASRAAVQMLSSSSSLSSPISTRSPREPVKESKAKEKPTAPVTTTATVGPPERPAAGSPLTSSPITSLTWNSAAAPFMLTPKSSLSSRMASHSSDKQLINRPSLHAPPPVAVIQQPSSIPLPNTHSSPHWPYINSSPVISPTNQSSPTNFAANLQGTIPRVEVTVAPTRVPQELEQQLTNLSPGSTALWPFRTAQDVVAYGSAHIINADTLSLLPIMWSQLRTGFPHSLLAIDLEYTSALHPPRDTVGDDLQVLQWIVDHNDIYQLGLCPFVAVSANVTPGNVRPTTFCLTRAWTVEATAKRVDQFYLSSREYVTHFFDEPSHAMREQTRNYSINQYLRRRLNLGAFRCLLTDQPQRVLVLHNGLNDVLLLLKWLKPVQLTETLQRLQTDPTYYADDGKSASPSSPLSSSSTSSSPSSRSFVQMWRNRFDRSRLMRALRELLLSVGIGHFYDTRLLYAVLRNVSHGQSNLKALVERFLISCLDDSASLAVNRLHDNLHTSGYDALLTAALFAQLQRDPSTMSQLAILENCLFLSDTQLDY